MALVAIWGAGCVFDYECVEGTERVDGECTRISSDDGGGMDAAPMDAGRDAASDAGRDALTDAGRDAPRDAGPDVVADSGVSCTAETEEERCGEMSCSALTNTCTETMRGSRELCQSCEADSECKPGFSGERRCVALDGMDAHRGYYCLEPTETESDCDFGAVAFESDSINGVSATYCAPEVDKMTCEAYRDYVSARDCTPTSETSTCGDPSITDGLCRDDGEGSRCTIPCDPLETRCPCNDMVTAPYCCTGTDSAGCELPM